MNTFIAKKTRKLSILISAFLFLFSSVLLAEEAAETNSSANDIKVAEEPPASIEQTMSADADTNMSISKGSAKSSEKEKSMVCIPSADKYDWIQLNTDEWLKGEIKGMYKDSLEFDSKNLGLLTIDWTDVKILRSHRVDNVNIDGVGASSGVLEVTDNVLRLTNDYEDNTYDRSKLISFTTGGKRERDLWAIKLVLSLGIRQGNTDQIDYTSTLNVERRGSTTRFLMDYIGNISKTNSGDGSLVDTINNHRLNASFNYYKTRNFFYTPAFAEFYSDTFQNIDLRTTVGAGLGYTVFDDARTELSFAGGPAYVKTDFVSVAPGQNSSETTPAAVLKTKYHLKVTKTLDFAAKYNIQIGNKASGGYTHHIILTVDSKIIGALDFNTSFIWDRTSNPTEAADGTTPIPNDFGLTFGISYTY